MQLEALQDLQANITEALWQATDAITAEIESLKEEAYSDGEYSGAEHGAAEFSEMLLGILPDFAEMLAAKLWNDCIFHGFVGRHELRTLISNSLTDFIEEPEAHRQLGASPMWKEPHGEIEMRLNEAI